MKLIFVRHGETEENLRDITQGHLPGKLSEKGREQAMSIGKALEGEKIDAIYSSDLNRARETVDEILKSHEGVPVFYTREARERFLGPLQGKVVKSKMEYFSVKGMETLHEVHERAKKLLGRISEEHPSDTVLLVSHRGFCMALLAVMLGRKPNDLEGINQSRACINTAEKLPSGAWVVREMNSTSHLENGRDE